MSSRFQSALLAASLLTSLLCAPECWRILREDIGDPWAGRGRPLAELAPDRTQERVASREAPAAEVVQADSELASTAVVLAPK